MKKKARAEPGKKICLKEGQIKQLIDSARGRNDECEEADEYIHTLDERYDKTVELETKKRNKKAQTVLERIMKEWL